MGSRQQSEQRSAASSKPSQRLRSVPDVSDDFDEQRWEGMGAAFDDDPRGTVRKADKALREQIHLLINRLSSMQSRLLRNCDARDDASLDELRECFRRYRALALRVAEMTPKPA